MSNLVAAVWIGNQFHCVFCSAVTSVKISFPVTYVLNECYVVVINL